MNVIDTQPNTIKLEISVTDTGYGIPADKLDLIFEPFHQLNNEYIRQSSRHGTGLGLAIVKKLTEHLGLEIKVTSTPGLGSRFSITGEFKTNNRISLPLPCLTKERLPQTDVKTSLQLLAAKKPKILLIEDDPIIQFIHKKMLEELKCEVDIATNGHDALKMLDQHHMVFIDINLYQWL